MTAPKPLPPANPQWRRSPPRESKDGRRVSIDLMALHDQAEHNRIFKVSPVITGRRK